MRYSLKEIFVNKESSIMQKKVLLSLSFVGLFLTSCQFSQQESSSKRPSKLRQVVYQKSYENEKDLLEEMGDPKDLDSTAVYKKDVGKMFHDTFTKETGRSQTSDYRPAER